jgi:sugar/nucleoside kinase (ribokinase family)
MPDAERILHTYLGANYNLSPSDLRNDAITNAEYIFIESFYECE